MATSQRLRVGDVRAIYKLLGECRELGVDSILWRTHLFRELCRLTGAKLGIGGGSRVGPDGWLAPQPETAVEFGWSDDSERDYLLAYYQNGAYREDECLQGLVRSGMISAQPLRRVVTITRPQMVADRLWYSSPAFCDYRRYSRIDDGLLSFAPLPDGLTHGVTVHRAVGERPFERRQRRLVHLLHRELAPLLGRELAMPGQDPLSRLTPRLRQVLVCLLEGDAEQQAALRLGVTCDTAHQYVKAVYRGFGVRSRGELLARFIRVPAALSPGV